MNEIMQKIHELKPYLLVAKKWAPNVTLGLLVVIAVYWVFAIVRVVWFDDVVVAATPDYQSSNERYRWRWVQRPRSQQAEQAPVAEQPKDDDNLDEASTNAKLLGVMISNNIAIASISSRKDPNGVFKAGDEIEDNLRLEEVQHHRVIVTQRGIRKQMSLKKELAESKDSKQSSLIEVQENEPESDSGLGVAGMFGAQPVNVNGEFGLKLNDLSDQIKGLADIRDGDAVTSVGGVSVADLMGDPLLWQSFLGSSQVPIKLVREGEEVEVFINAASLASNILPALGQGGFQ